MIARPVNAPLVRRSMVWLLAALAVLTLVACKKKEKPFPPAPQLHSTATTEGASLGPHDAGLVPVAASALPSPVDTMSPADRTALEEVKETVEELDALVKKGAFTNPDKPGAGDANFQCGALEASRARIEALADPEAKKLAAEARRLCSFEVPLISADRTLKQVSISPSQASRQLMCKYASKDLDKARSVKAGDPRLRDLQGRFGRACNR